MTFRPDWKKCLISEETDVNFPNGSAERVLKSRDRRCYRYYYIQPYYARLYMPRPPRTPLVMPGVNTYYTMQFSTYKRTAFSSHHGGLLVFRHAARACSQVPEVPPHRLLTMSHVLDRTMFSTICSCRTSDASCSVRASRGKNRPEYGSSLSFTILFLSFSLSASLKAASGSSGSGAVATIAQ